MSDDVKEEMREALADEFGNAEFPANNQMELAAALSSGPSTKFSAGDIEVTAMELAAKGGSKMDFPYEELDDFLDDAIEAMDDEGYFDED